MSEKNRAEFEQRLAEFAEQSPEFREKLKSAPKEALSTLMGMDLPDGMNIVVHEEDENTLHFVLPPVGEELTAVEMTSVSGGVCWSNCGCEDYEGITQ